MAISPKTHMRVVNLESGLPTVEDARHRLRIELESSKKSGVAALKLIHGYGSSGVGGAIRVQIRRSLIRRRKEGAVRAVIFGENWSIFNEDCLHALVQCPELKKDRDLNSSNPGVSIVLL
jgi:hypothetical protein